MVLISAEPVQSYLDNDRLPVLQLSIWVRNDLISLPDAQFLGRIDRD